MKIGTQSQRMLSLAVERDDDDRRLGACMPDRPIDAGRIAAGLQDHVGFGASSVVIRRDGFVEAQREPRHTPVQRRFDEQQPSRAGSPCQKAAQQADRPASEDHDPIAERNLRVPDRRQRGLHVRGEHRAQWWDALRQQAELVGTQRVLIAVRHQCEDSRADGHGIGLAFADLADPGVAIAQQLVVPKHLLLMDEPFSGLDPAALEDVIRLLVDVANLDELNTIVLVTHDIHSALIISDTVYMLGRDRGPDGTAEPRVEFLGFTPSGEVACRWVSDKVRLLRLEEEQPLAPTVPVRKPQIAPKRRDEGDAAAEALR